MAKIREALRGRELRRPEPDSSRREPDGRPEIKLLVPGGDECEFPYIEVGGKGQPVEGSPDVVGPPPQPEVLSPTQQSALHYVGRRDPAAVSGLPGQGTAARGGVAAELVVHHDRRHPLSQKYTELAEGLVSLQSPPQAVGFTSLSLGNEPATVLLNVALAEAMRGDRRVAVVDLDHRAPAVGPLLALADAPGLNEVLAGHVALEQAIHPAAGLSALPLSADWEAATPLDSPEVLAWVVGWLRPRFDRIYACLPRWQDRPAWHRLAAAFDAIFPVVTLAENAGPDLDAVIRSVADGGGQVRGIISLQGQLAAVGG